MMRSRYLRADGFSVIELMVGILVGAIVLTMAIAIVVSTNRTSVQLMSRQEVSQSTRVAVTQVLKELGSAQTLLDCRVWTSNEDQATYAEYKREIADALENNLPVVAVEGGFRPEKCHEYFETGTVLVHAQPNSVCWNKDISGGGRIDTTKDPIIACLARPLDSYGSEKQPLCPGGNLDDTHVLYYYECKAPPNFSYFSHPQHFINSTASFTYQPGSLRPILELVKRGVDQAFVDANLPASIFSYQKTDGSTTTNHENADITRIETVYINLDIAYVAAQGSGLDGTDFNIYRFSQKVLLQGARAFLEQGAYGGNYAG